MHSHIYTISIHTHTHTALGGACVTAKAEVIFALYLSCIFHALFCLSIVRVCANVSQHSCDSQKLDKLSSKVPNSVVFCRNQTDFRNRLFDILRVTINPELTIFVIIERKCRLMNIHKLKMYSKHLIYSLDSSLSCCKRKRSVAKVQLNLATQKT